MHTLRIATRNSRLALWQAEQVATLLREHHPGLVVELVGMSTEGDKRLDTQLYKLGGKGLFLKELQTALLEDKADLAVHSAKDIPALLPCGSHLAAVLERHDPRDALVSNDYASMDSLPQGAVIGTSSLRRSGILRYRYPHLVIRDIRGNLDTRLGKLDRGDYQALILAVAGLTRLGADARIRQRLAVSSMLPALGQGTIAIEVRDRRPEIAKLVTAINHSDSWQQLACERAFGAELGADCHLPIAAYATCNPTGQFHLQALVVAHDGSRIIQGEISGNDPQKLGSTLAMQLLKQGAAELFRHLP